ncbi:unnamed protein product [Cylicocyclus nassatus]|uniref:Uncharacterized protein n=1 Tax=Cylicocyclus nassatus TaxID=53992 RepID=A0AA36GER0_CYLNA|nr:unnamed protein product [Cylicocyclus nassatus]
MNMEGRGDDQVEVSESSSQNVAHTHTECGEKELVLHRALPIRIKTMYKCEEQRLITMAPPFRGFSALVRFQCRARLHHVQKISAKELEAQLMEKEPCK